LKKTILATFLGALVLLSSGCLEKNNLDNATIYTTVYPISYFTEVLYGTHSKINSIYPDGANILTYQLTDKQKAEYSKGNVFIYNGLSDEKQIAKDFSNSNRHLQIIDVAYGLKYKYGMEELWLSPSNALMLASTIKNNLETFIGNKFINEEINTKYKTLEETLSVQDAELRNISRNAQDKGKNTLIVSSNMFKFLEDYGFHIISLEDNSSENSLNILKKDFKNGTYKYLFMKNTEDSNDVIHEMKNNGANIITVHTMTTLSDENRKNNDNYFILMQEFIDNIKNAVLN
jgi:zinc transport system substrate-binding protein